MTSPSLPPAQVVDRVSSFIELSFRAPLKPLSRSLDCVNGYHRLRCLKKTLRTCIHTGIKDGLLGRFPTTVAFPLPSCPSPY